MMSLAANLVGLRDLKEMWLLPSDFQYLRSAAILALAVCIILPAAAQDRPQDLHVQSATPQDEKAQTAPPAKPAKPPKPYGGGSPLDVLMHSKLWETPPEAKPFVKESRDPSSDLHYLPTAGTDLERPKLLSSDQLKSLQGELEQAGAHNEKAAGVKKKNKNFTDVGLSKATKGKSHKGKAEKARAEMPTQLHTR